MPYTGLHQFFLLRNLQKVTQDSNGKKKNVYKVYTFPNLLHIFSQSDNSRFNVQIHLADGYLQRPTYEYRLGCQQTKIM